MTVDLPRSTECVFSKEELDDRLLRVRKALPDAGCDVLVLTSPENIFWLSGQQTPGYYTFQALVVPVDAEPFFVIRRLEMLNCAANSRIETILPYEDDELPAVALVRALTDRGLKGRRLAVEKRGWFLTAALYQAIDDALGPLSDGSGIIEPLRQVKSAAEIGFIEAAAGYADAGMRAGLDATRAGATENDVVAAMMGAAIAAGSEYFGMEPLVSSGPRCGVPHGTWRRRKLEDGDAMFLELAAVHNRYHAGLMRSAWLGEPPALARRMHETCLEALTAALGALKPGATCAEVHGACQAVIDREGFTEAYRKRTGYSIGISFAPDWGEGNVLSLFRGVDRVIEPGMVFHIPPALRVYGEYTTGVSETAVVTEDGNRPLSAIARDLVVID